MSSGKFWQVFGALIEFGVEKFVSLTGRFLTMFRSIFGWSYTRVSRRLGASLGELLMLYSNSGSKSFHYLQASSKARPIVTIYSILRLSRKLRKISLIFYSNSESTSNFTSI